MKTLLTLITLVYTLSVSAVDFAIDRIHEPTIQAQLAGKNLAVLTHAAGVDRAGVHLIDHLHGSFALKKIFAPEHGLRSLEDDWVGDGTDERTGLPVISLYKRGTRAPTQLELQGIDAIVIDLQDVGVRYYTYFSTIAEVMKAATQANIEVILLDRPNLMGGVVEGEVLTTDLAGGFTSYHTVPTRHGMTLGELARMINAEKNMGCRLTVIPAQGWQRESLWDKWDRTWTPPSPALVDAEQIPLYALWGTLENFNLAVGRGKTNEEAFRVVGAPWITEAEAKRLAVELNGLGFKDVQFTAHSWMVTRAAHTGKLARGVRLTGTFDSIRTDAFTYEVARTLVKMFAGRINAAEMSARSYGSQRLVNSIRAQVPFHAEQARIDAALKAFEARRAPFLLY